MTAVLAFLTSRTGAYLILCVSIVAGLWAGAAWLKHKGYAEAEAHYKTVIETMIAEQKQEQANYEREAQKLAERRAGTHVEKVRVIRNSSAATIKAAQEIPNAQMADGKCSAPHRLREVHDAAAQGIPVPTATSESGKPDPAATPAAVATAVVTNYAACHEAIAEVATWRGWYAEQSKLANLRGAE